MTAPAHLFPPPFSPRTAWIIALASLLICLLFGVLADAGQQARWHRYASSQLDSHTTIDVVKDVYSQQCYAVYKAYSFMNGGAPAVAPLGPVPCEPVVGR